MMKAGLWRAIERRHHGLDLGQSHRLGVDAAETHGILPSCQRLHFLR